MKCARCQLSDLRRQASKEGKFMHVIPRQRPVVEVKFTWPDEVLNQGPGSGWKVHVLAGEQLRARFENGIPDTCQCGLRGVLDRLGRGLVKKLHKLIRYR